MKVANTSSVATLVDVAVVVVVDELFIELFFYFVVDRENVGIIETFYKWWHVTNAL